MSQSTPQKLEPVLIFDFDGTLCDDLKAAIVILNQLAEEYRFGKVDADRLEVVREHSTREIMRELGVPRLKLPLILSRARRILGQRLEELQPIPGIPEALRELSHRGYQMGLLTSNSATNVRRFLERHQLSCFRFLYSGSSLFGKEKLIRKLLRERHLTAPGAIYIGDETRDVDAARAARVRVVAVSWGFNSARILQQAKPDFLIAQPADLVSLVSTLEIY